MDKAKIRKNCNWNEWYLERELFDFEKGKCLRTYGWITKLDDGSFRVGVPDVYDPKTDSDARIVGKFESFWAAAEKLFQANNPYYSTIYIGR